LNNAIFITLGYSVVEKVVDSQYRYDTNTIVTNANISIGYLMQLVVDVDVGIETLYIDWQKYSADGKNGSQ
jgi:hypothetical protein